MNPATFASLPSSACTAATAGADGADRITQTTYDAAGRPTSTTSALGQSEAITESVTYTANGQTASLTDGNGNVSIVEYDGHDRAVKLRYPNASGGGTSTTDVELTGYDAAGNATSFQNRAGQTFTTTYDALNRPTYVVAPSGTSDRSFQYDLLNRTVNANDATQSLYATWDALGRKTGGAASARSRARRLPPKPNLAISVQRLGRQFLRG